MVQYWIDGGGHVVEHAGDVRGNAIQLMEKRYVLRVQVTGRCVTGPEYGDKSLRVKGGPADEKRHHNGH